MEATLSPALSVIVPLHRSERIWRNLCSCLLFLPDGAEVIFVRPTRLRKSEEGYLSLLRRKKFRIRWLTGRAGRAAQMNQGAKSAGSTFLWFLHADSLFSPSGVKALLKSIASAPGAVHYFDLEYLRDGPLLSQLNGRLANFRSRVLNTPFGDQGLCLSRDLFLRLGGFDLNCEYGEDHILIRKARLLDVKLRCTGETIQTSARKFRDQGWAETTIVHFYRTWKQALPWIFQGKRAWR